MGRSALALALAAASCCTSVGLSFSPLAASARRGSGHRRFPSSGTTTTTTARGRTPPPTITAADRTTDGGRDTADPTGGGGKTEPTEPDWLSTDAGGAVDTFNAVSVKAVKGVIDVVMCGRPFARFYALETIARVPYFGASDGGARRVSPRLKPPNRSQRPSLPPLLRARSLSAYLSVLHLRETLGIWRHPELLELHFSGE